MSIMQVSRKVEYALRAAIYLAYQSDRRPCSVAEIAAREADIAIVTSDNPRGEDAHAIELFELPPMIVDAEGQPVLLGDLGRLIKEVAGLLDEVHRLEIVRAFAGDEALDAECLCQIEHLVLLITER